MSIIKKVLLTFIFVLSGITLSATVFISVFVPQWPFTVVLLWEFIAMAAFCTLGDVIFYSRKELSKGQMKLRITMHYIYINVSVLGGALLFGWLEPGVWSQILLMLVMIAAVYVGVMTASFQQEEKTAKNLNERLSKMNASKNE